MPAFLSDLNTGRRLSDEKAARYISLWLKNIFLKAVNQLCVV